MIFEVSNSTNKFLKNSQIPSETSLVSLCICAVLSIFQAPYRTSVSSEYPKSCNPSPNNMVWSSLATPMFLVPISALLCFLRL